MPELKPVSEIFGKKASDATKNLLDTVPNIRIKTRLAEILDRRKISQADLVRLTGIPKNQISAFVTNKPTAKLAYHHIIALMIALRLDSIDQLLYIDMPDEIKEQFKSEAKSWDDTRREPASVQSLMKQAEEISKI